MAARVKTTLPPGAAALFLPAAALLLPAAALLLPAAAVAQNSPAPRTLPGLDDFSLPGTRPTPRLSPAPEPTTNPRSTATPSAVAPPRIVPTVRATPVPRPTATPVQPPAAVPRSVATPAPRPVPTAAASAAPLATPVPVGTPTPVIDTPLPAPLPLPEAAPLPEASPAPLPTLTPPVAAQPGFVVEPWMWLTLAALLALLAATGIGWWWRQRAVREEAEQRDDRRHEIFVFDTPEVPVALPTPPAPPPPAPPPPAPSPAPEAATSASAPEEIRATLDLGIVVKRAGTNLLSAAVEYSILIENIGQAVATGIHVDVRLLSAGPAQDAQIAALFQMPITRPNTTPFDLPPGTTVDLGGMALHPKETLEVMTVGDRSLFVPVLAVNVTYDWQADGANASGQTARSYVIGIDRGGDAKLQPFRRDAAARMYDTVGALAYTTTAIR